MRCKLYGRHAVLNESGCESDFPAPGGPVSTINRLGSAERSRFAEVMIRLLPTIFPRPSSDTSGGPKTF